MHIMHHKLPTHFTFDDIDDPDYFVRSLILRSAAVEIEVRPTTSRTLIG